MNFFFSKLHEICPLLSNCKQADGKSCIKYHPRCFSGICINHLNGNCNLIQCSLQHLTQEVCTNQLRNEINGVYLINLCPNAQDCKQLDKCLYLHRDWIDQEKICMQYLNQKCKSNTCKREHITWEDLKENVQEKYDQEGLAPNILCEKPECKCRRHLKQLEGFCIANFKGLCQSKGKCPRVHCDWEISNDVKPDQFENEKVLPCCIQAKNSQQTIQVEIQEKFLALFKKNDIKKIQNHLKEQNVVDLLLIMDLTDSMYEWIDSVKNNLLIIIDKFKTIIKNVQIRIAFVGYRDFCDGDKHIVFHEFTPEVLKIKEFIQNQVAEGGGDSAEDVAGGLEKALSLNFSQHPDSVLCTFLFGDAPTHGRQYHKLGFQAFDEKIDTIEKGYLEKIMKDFKKLKRNNFFSCCKITQNTELMFQIMQQNFEGLIISEFSTQQLTDHMAFTLVNSYNSSQKYDQKNKQKIRIAATYMRHKLIQPKLWNKSENDNELNHEARFMAQLGSHKIGGDTVLEIDVNPIELKFEEKGACSEIFSVFDIRNNRKLIAKIPRKTYLAMKEQQMKNPYGLHNINEELSNELRQEAYHRYFSTLLAQHFAVGYREKLRKNEKAPPIFYVSPIIYTLNQQFYGMKVLYAETEIDLPDEKWGKITNNAGSLMIGKEAYGAFSHLSFTKSNRKLMITDLQGKCGIFSDPAIHVKSKQSDEDCKVEINNKPVKVENTDETQCDENEARKLNSLNSKYYLVLQTSLTDAGLAGIKNFFDNQHSKCNELCKELKLDRKIFNTKDNAEDKKDEKGNNDDEDNKANNNEEDNNDEIIKVVNIAVVHCICDICGNQYKLDYNDYKSSEKNEFYCWECSTSTEREDICECCGEKFLHHHERTLRMGQVPTLCLKCDECKEAEQKCLYCYTKCKKMIFHEIDMSGTKNFICQKGYEYFEQLQCLGCNKPFEKKEWFTKDEYTSGIYYCKLCQKKKNK